MELSIEISGLDRVVAAFAKAPELMAQEVRAQLKTELYAIGSAARFTHNYNTKSGNLERSTDVKVDADGLAGSIWLSKTKAKAPYAWRIHEGFAGHTDSLGRHFKGPQPDQFLYKAAEVRREAFGVEMGKAVERGIKKAGL